MERYRVVKEVGSGSFGSVWLAINKQSDEVVAIKKLKEKYYSWNECVNLREVKALYRLNHPNIVKLREVIKEKNELFLVFEYMECNLYQVMKNRKYSEDENKKYSEDEIKNWCFQVFQGLAYMHQRGYFHRDLKPENLLFNKNVIKIADFGLAREIDSDPPYTEYVSTRWYRAPEVMLYSKMYSSKVDMWAMGAIMAELFTLKPLFPGISEADEIYKICKVIGSPRKDSWADGLVLAKAINYQFPQFGGIPLSVLIPSASEDAISLIMSLCSWDPCKRPTAMEALQHPFFRSCYYIPPHVRSRTACTSNMKLSTNCTSPKSDISMSTDMQCKQEIVNENANKNDESLKKGSIRQGIYIPPGKRSGRTDCEVSVTTEKLANMMIAPARHCVGQPMQLPPMRAGVQWSAASKHFYVRPTQQKQPDRFCSKTVDRV